MKIIALYLGDSTDEDYLDRLEDIIETLLTLHGGRTVLRFLIEQLIIDIPSLLENLSKKDSVLRYSFLLLLKSVLETEQDLFFPFSEDLLDSDDPNVREAVLQLLVFIASGENVIEDVSLINKIVEKLSDEKDFVVEKAIQALKTIGKNNPSLVTKSIKNFIKDYLDDEEIKACADNILKSIVSIEKIEEIVEEEETIEKEKLKHEETEIIDKELELKKKQLELKKKKLELEEREKELEEKIVSEKNKALQLKEEIMEKEKSIDTERKAMDFPKKVKKEFQKEESEILDREIELKKKDLELKRKKLELESKEKEIEELEIKKREEVLKHREELFQKENELSEVDLELQQKKINEKKQKIVEDEMKRMEERLKKLEEERNKSNS